MLDVPHHHYAYDYRSLSLLAASDRIQHCSRVIVPELKKGRLVISDRYFYSCLANLRARGYTEDRWIYEVADFEKAGKAVSYTHLTLPTICSV